MSCKPNICVPSVLEFPEAVGLWAVLCHCRYYAIMVTMFFTVSVVNNYALNLNIAMPLHMIFRSVSATCPVWTRMAFISTVRRRAAGEGDLSALL